MEQGFDPELLNEPLTFYRGTQRPSIKGARKILSFTPSLPVAIIWSAVPGDIWGGTQTHFVPASTVHTIQVIIRNPLILSNSNWSSLANVLYQLRYGYVGGIEPDEVRKIYNYLHNRLVGKAKGGEFKYNVVDADGDRVEEDDVPFSLTIHETAISWVAREDWDYEPTIETAQRLEADTYIFADAPVVNKAALAQGYDAILYPDVFQGGEAASEKLFGCPVTDLHGVWEEADLDDDWVPTHWTLRLIDPSIVISHTSTTTKEVLRIIDPCTIGHEDEP